MEMQQVIFQDPLLRLGSRKRCIKTGYSSMLLDLNDVHYFHDIEALSKGYLCVFKGTV